MRAGAWFTSVLVACAGPSARQLYDDTMGVLPHPFFPGPAPSIALNVTESCFAGHGTKTFVGDAHGWVGPEGVFFDLRVALNECDVDGGGRVTGAVHFTQSKDVIGSVIETVSGSTTDDNGLSALSCDLAVTSNLGADGGCKWDTTALVCGQTFTEHVDGC